MCQTIKIIVNGTESFLFFRSFWISLHSTFLWIRCFNRSFAWFKDVILGLVAGVQLTANNMIRKGDWRCQSTEQMEMLSMLP